MTDWYIKGAGMTKFGIEDRNNYDLAYESSLEALDDADMNINDIDAIVVANCDTKVNDERQRHFTCLISSLFKRKIPIIQITAVCGGGGAAFWTALRLKYNNILVLATDKIASNTSPIITNEILQAAEKRYDQDEGLIFPAENALVATEYFSKYDADTDDLALISFKNHENAFLNPKAHFYGKKISLEAIKNSPIVASPLRLYDCSISVNGAAAVIITKDKTDIQIKASALATDYIAPFEREDMTKWRACCLAAAEAYNQAGIGPEDINIVEIHDAFTIVELISYEDLGFAKKGYGSKLIRDGIVNLDGKLPVNTSGGLKARGHPISPTGIAQVYEIVKQLRNEAGDRQVSRNKYGMTQNIGGAGGSISIHIFKKISG